MEEGQVELVIPARILIPDITDLVIGFLGDICVSRRYAGTPTLYTFVVMDLDAIQYGLEYTAVEVDEWRSFTEHLAEDEVSRTGWACDLCSNDHGAVCRATVGYVDLRLHRKLLCLPNTQFNGEFIADCVRFEEKNICFNCHAFTYNDFVYDEY